MQTPQEHQNTTNQTPANQEKQSEIIAMFDAIAKDYDKTNRILSLGIDISWRIDAVKRAYKLHSQNLAPHTQHTQDSAQNQAPKQIAHIVDVACGSGDMMKHWQNQAKKLGVAIAQLTGIDPSAQMLKLAHKKLIDSRLESSPTQSSPAITLIQAQATDLSMLESQSVDILSISYGLRNVLEYEQALREFARVLKPGGVVVVLDFFKNPKPSLLDRLVGLYTKHMLPYIGYLISRNFKAYKYLPDSMESFISPSELADSLQKFGLTCAQIKSYSAGISHLVLGQKPCDRVDKS